MPRETAIEEILEHVERDGAVIIEQLLSPDIVTAFNAEVDEIVAATRPGSRYGEADGGHHGANTKRVSGLTSLSRTFRERILNDPLVLGVSRAVMTRLSDSYWMSAAQLIEIGPGNAPQPLHRDMETFPVFRAAGPDGPEVMCNFLTALTDFTAANGATRIIPGSNRWPDFERINRRESEPLTIRAEMRAGDSVFMSGKIVHGGGANTTADEYRRGLALSFCPGFLVPEEAHPFFVPMEVVRTLAPEVQQLLGFRSFHNRVQHGGSLWQDGYDELGDFLGL